MDMTLKIYTDCAHGSRAHLVACTVRCCRTALGELSFSSEVDCICDWAFSHHGGIILEVGKKVEIPPGGPCFLLESHPHLPSKNHLAIVGVSRMYRMDARMRHNGQHNNHPPATIEHVHGERRGGENRKLDDLGD